MGDGIGTEAAKPARKARSLAEQNRFEVGEKNICTEV